ncbi:MAG: hypothetical protein LBT43_09330 [Prevotella sp.]|nr:hypothetical protein [Prevotella sp.]
MDNIYFVSDGELSVTSETYYINKDGSVYISTGNILIYSIYIDNLSSDSLVFIDSHLIHDEYKRWHYTRLPQK